MRGGYVQMDDEVNKQLEPVKSKERQLTPRNWLFIKYYLETGNPRTAFDKAGYKGKSYSAPYEMVFYLKSDIKKIAENNGVGQANILINVKNLIDRPLGRMDMHGRMHEVTHLSPNEHMKALTLAHKLTDKKEKDSRQLSPVIINTDGDGKTQVNIGVKGLKGTKAVEKEDEVGPVDTADIRKVVDTQWPAKGT